MAIFYLAIIERGSDGFGVFFPDVPGCVTVGKTMQEAAQNAQDALAAHLELGLEHGEVIPEATSVDAYVSDLEVDEAGRILVRFDPPAKSVRVNVTIPENQLAEFDRYAADNGFTRSGLFCLATKEYIGSRLESVQSDKLRQHYISSAFQNFDHLSANLNNLSDEKKASLVMQINNRAELAKLTQKILSDIENSFLIQSNVCKAALESSKTKA